MVFEQRGQFATDRHVIERLDRVANVLLIPHQTLGHQIFVGQISRGANDVIAQPDNVFFPALSHRVVQAKAGDVAKQGEVSARWYKNADDIAVLLSETNPKNWPREEMQRLMHKHLRLTTDEIAARMGGHYADDIAAHDKVHRQILQVADKLSAGIMNQFPDKTTERP